MKFSEVSRLQRNRVSVAKIVLFIIVAYLLAGWADAPGGDIAQLTPEQRAEVVNRWR